MPSPESCAGLRRRYEIHQCVAPACNLRYPVPDPATGGAPVCPRCRGPVTVTQVTRSPIGTSPAVTVRGPATLVGVLDNLRSAYNVGSIFRIADGLGMPGLHLCGITATPAHPKVAKTALSAERSVAWAYHANGPQAVATLRSQGRQILALEVTREAVALHAIAHHVDLTRPAALVVGNELTGVDPDLLEAADHVVALPMAGVKESLNVAVAFGIAAHWIIGARQAAYALPNEQR